MNELKEELFSLESQKASGTLTPKEHDEAISTLESRIKRAQNHAPARLCHQPEPAMVDRKGLRVAEANWPTTAGQVARPGESGLAVRLQLRSTQPDPAAATDGSTTANAPGAVRLSNCCEPQDDSLRPAKPYKHLPEPHFKQISNERKRKSPRKTPQSGEFQRVPRNWQCQPFRS